MLPPVLRCILALVVSGQWEVRIMRDAGGDVGRGVYAV